MFHILVVDDDRSTRLFMRAFLEAEHYTVSIAANGEEALDVMEKEHIDLVVLDISGPNMHPVHDLTNNIVYSASGSDVVMTICDGRVLYENGEYKTIDIEKTLFEAGRMTKSILAQL